MSDFHSINQFNNASIDKEMIVRTVVLFLVLLNQGLVLYGLSPLPFESEKIEIATTIVLTVGAILWTWNNDNDVSRKARHRTQYNKEKGLK